MIAPVSIPPSPTFTRNPVAFTLRVTDENGDVYGPQPASSALRTTVSSFQDGETFSFSYVTEEGFSEQIDFTCATSPSGIDQVPAIGIGANIADYEAIAAAIQAHPEISPYFILTVEQISASNYRIRATSRTTAYNPTPTWDAGTLTGPTEVQDVAPVADNTPDNLKVYLDVLFESEYESGIFAIAARLENTIDEDGYVRYDLQYILDKEFRLSMAEPPLPAYDNDSVVIADNLRRYILRYRESYDGIDAADAAWQLTDKQLVMIGGISQPLFAQANYFSQITNESSFLTWYPDKKVVGRKQIEYLPWYNYLGFEVSTPGPGDVTGFRIIAYDEDGQELSSNLRGIGTVADSHTVLLPVGPEQLSLDAATAKYTIRVQREIFNPGDGGTSITFYSPLRTFYVDRDYYDEERYLQYINSFGCPVTVRCVGAHTEELSIRRLNTTRLLSDIYPALREVYQYDQDFTQPLTYRTGFLSKKEAIALQEMLVQNYTYELLDQSYYPIHITDESFGITQTRQELHQVEFTAQRSLNPVNFSGEATIMVDMAEWELVGAEGSWLTTLPNTLWGLIPSDNG